mgnify:CR=1 FL=1
MTKERKTGFPRLLRARKGERFKYVDLSRNEQGANERAKIVGLNPELMSRAAWKYDCTANRQSGGRGLWRGLGTCGRVHVCGEIHVADATPKGMAGRSRECGWVTKTGKDKAEYCLCGIDSGHSLWKGGSMERTSDEECWRSEKVMGRWR